MLKLSKTHTFLYPITTIKKEKKGTKCQQVNWSEGRGRSNLFCFSSQPTFKHDSLCFGEIDTCIIRGLLEILLEVNVAYLPEGA